MLFRSDRRKAGQDVRPEGAQAQTVGTSSNADAWNPSPPARPNLDTMDQKTTEHSAAVSDALSQAN